MLGKSCEELLTAVSVLPELSRSSADKWSSGMHSLMTISLIKPKICGTKWMISIGFGRSPVPTGEPCDLKRRRLMKYGRISSLEDQAGPFAISCKQPKFFSFKAT